MTLYRKRKLSLGKAAQLAGEGNLYRVEMELTAHWGTPLTVEGTFLFGEKWTGPTVLGFQGFLERIRFARTTSPSFFHTPVTTTPLSANITNTQELDLNSILQASQALSGEMVLEKLLAKLSKPKEWLVKTRLPSGKQFRWHRVKTA